MTLVETFKFRVHQKEVELSLAMALNIKAMLLILRFS